MQECTAGVPAPGEQRTRVADTGRLRRVTADGSHRAVARGALRRALRASVLARWRSDDENRGPDESGLGSFVDGRQEHGREAGR